MQFAKLFGFDEYLGTVVGNLFFQERRPYRSSTLSIHRFPRGERA